MVYETFLETVTSQLQEALGDSYQFMLRPLPKNNGVTLDGLTIQSPDCSVAPTIYLNPYYEQYQRGTDIHEIVHDILRLYRATPTPSFLQTDALERNEAGQMTALIHQEHMKRWNISVNDLWEAASHNTPLEYPAEIQSMSDLLREIARKNMGEHYDPELINKLLESEDAAPLYVLSNSNGLYGASCLVYKNVLKDFADHLQADLILLPSSVHEVLLTPNLPDTSYEALSSMVTSINRQEVSPEEQLSNQVYLFSRKDGSLKIVSNAPELVGTAVLS